MMEKFAETALKDFSGQDEEKYHQHAAVILIFLLNFTY